MAITAYCKKCNREVEPGDICPRCGTKLAKSAAHAAWVVERRPVTDWMCWNAVMRWLLPAGLAVLLLGLGLEAVSGGAEAVEKLLRSGFPVTVLLLFGGLLLIVFLALLLQGKELMDYVVDSRGVHVTRYLPEPTPVRLLARMKSPGLMSRLDPEAETPLLRLEEQDLPWRQVACAALAGKMLSSVLCACLVAADSGALHPLLLGGCPLLCPGQARQEKDGYAAGASEDTAGKKARSTAEKGAGKRPASPPGIGERARNPDIAP
ncbi:MAG: zinc ribbon domain-containing protein [Clostridia bacterium]|nr:zinc ribbon domain-containing protein [Clostridia bacterium]